MYLLSLFILHIYYTIYLLYLQILISVKFCARYNLHQYGSPYPWRTSTLTLGYSHIIYVVIVRPSITGVLCPIPSCPGLLYMYIYYVFAGCPILRIYWAALLPYSRTALLALYMYLLDAALYVFIDCAALFCYICSNICSNICTYICTYGTSSMTVCPIMYLFMYLYMYVIYIHIM